MLEHTQRRAAAMIGWTIASAMSMLVACGKTTLEPVGAGNGGSGAEAGTGAAGGVGGSGAGGVGGGTAGTSGSGGSSGGKGCDGQNPAGCVQTGCEMGFVCDTETSECRSSGCSCNPTTGTWDCDADCGGGVCVPDTGTAEYFVRVGFVQGQEATGEFCVAYQDDSGEQPLWETIGLMEANGLDINDYQFLGISRYMALKARPLYFGKATTNCSGAVAPEKVPADGKYFTFLSVPFSGEADQRWIIRDPDPNSAPTGARIVNATSESRPISVTGRGASDQVDFGDVPFANSPDSFQSLKPGGETSLHSLTVDDGFSVADFDFTQMDLLPLAGTTIFIAGRFGVAGTYSAIGCIGSNPTLPGSKFSNCFSVQEKL